MTFDDRNIDRLKNELIRVRDDELNEKRRNRDDKKIIEKSAEFRHEWDAAARNERFEFWKENNIIIRDDEIENLIIRDDDKRNERDFLRHEKRFVEIDELSFSRFDIDFVDDVDMLTFFAKHFVRFVFDAIFSIVQILI